ncbi:hypothetical protein L195_g041583, partial [Trifolium pratense]
RKQENGGAAGICAPCAGMGASCASCSRFGGSFCLMRLMHQKVVPHAPVAVYMLQCFFCSRQE